MSDTVYQSEEPPYLATPRGNRTINLAYNQLAYCGGCGHYYWRHFTSDTAGCCACECQVFTPSVLDPKGLTAHRRNLSWFERIYTQILQHGENLIKNRHLPPVDDQVLLRVHVMRHVAGQMFLRAQMEGGVVFTEMDDPPAVDTDVAEPPVPSQAMAVLRQMAQEAGSDAFSLSEDTRTALDREGVMRNPHEIFPLGAGLGVIGGTSVPSHDLGGIVNANIQEEIQLRRQLIGAGLINPVPHYREEIRRLAAEQDAADQIPSLGEMMDAATASDAPLRSPDEFVTWLTSRLAGLRERRGDEPSFLSRINLLINIAVQEIGRQVLLTASVFMFERLLSEIPEFWEIIFDRSLDFLTTVSDQVLAEAEDSIRELISRFNSDTIRAQAYNHLEQAIFRRRVVAEPQVQPLSRPYVNRLRPTLKNERFGVAALDHEPEPGVKPPSALHRIAVEMGRSSI